MDNINKLRQSFVSKCAFCGNEFIGKSFQVYCNKACQRGRNKANTIGTGLSHIPTGTVGAIAELVVSADLMRKGYDVYRALSPSCHADLLAIKEDEIIKYEVRTGVYYTNHVGKTTLKYPVHRTSGKILVIFTHSDGKIHYSIDTP